MIRPDIQIDTTNLERLLQHAQKQIPFAIATALNTTANAAQQAVRATLDDRFTIRGANRRGFLERTIKIENADRAKKSRLAVRVGIDQARNVLAKFEDQTSKVPTRGREMLAVPVAARPSPDAIVPKKLRIPNLKLRPETRRDRLRMLARKVGLGRRVAEPRIVGEQRTFMAGGLILQNQGRGRNERIRVLYALKPRVKIQPVLGFRRTVARTVERVWEREVLAAVDKALRTARK